jgi:hypothetical protein
MLIDGFDLEFYLKSYPKAIKFYKANGIDGIKKFHYLGGGKYYKTYDEYILAQNNLQNNENNNTIQNNNLNVISEIVSENKQEIISTQNSNYINVDHILSMYPKSIKFYKSSGLPGLVKYCNKFGISLYNKKIKKEIISEIKPEIISEIISEIKPEIISEIISEIKPEIKSEIKPEIKSEIKPEIKSEIKPEIISENIQNNNSFKTIYIISKLEGGGAIKYLDDIVNMYKDICNFIYFHSKSQLNNFNFKKDDILFLQHLFYSDLSVDDIINIKNNFNCKLIISIHDWYWLNDKILTEFDNSTAWHNSYLNKNINIDPQILKLFENSDDIIHPSKFTFNIFSKYFKNNNFKLIYHNDYKIDYTIKNVPLIKNNTINIGVLHSYSEYKGKENIEILRSIKNYNGYNIEWKIVGINIKEYKEKEFYEYIEKYNINALTLLNKWGETWCYSLTKFINSGLPIIYNNYGAFKERIPCNIEHYFKVFENEEENDINKLNEVYLKMLNFIILNNGKYNIINNDTKIIYNNYYDKLFSKINQLNIFPIYFPQFHKIPENDKNYYDGFNDIKNLSLYFNENSSNPENLEKINKNIFEINNIIDYDLTNDNITIKQINIAKQYGISGFAIYYYWFSINSITNNNLIMECGYNNFFKDILENFKVFFVWANEDWSNNPAFNTSDQILNIYNSDNFIENGKNLIKYFKHPNYYKIDNKPIFLIHHPWFIKNEQLDSLYQILNNLCILNGFSGINFIVNSMNDYYDKYYNYSFHPNYKKPLENTLSVVNGKNTLNYKKYIDNIKLSNNQINTLFFDFNNTARLYKPNKLNKSTRLINNTDENIVDYINKIKHIYNYNTIPFNLLLVNAWNEWGEKMHIEPSEEKGYYYLEKIKLLK